MPLRPIYEFEIGNKNAYRSFWMDKIIRLAHEDDLKSVECFGYYSANEKPEKPKVNNKQLEQMFALFKRVGKDIRLEHDKAKFAEF